MTKKSQKSQTKRGRGRSSIQSGDDPIIEGRLAFIADLVAAQLSRGQIQQRCKEENEWSLSTSQIDRYLKEVRRRWKEENGLYDLLEKKHHAIESLRRIFRKAEERTSFTEFGKEYENPDHWLMRQIIMDIAKFEGLLEAKDPLNPELEKILDELTAIRASGRDQEGPK